MKHESGQISVLIIGCFTIIGLLAVVVINSSAAFVQKQRLADLADGAALIGADAIRADHIYANGLTNNLPLDATRARSAIASYLSSTGVTWTIQTASQTVRVQLRDQIDLPLVPPGWRSRTTIVAESTALLRTH